MKRIARSAIVEHSAHEMYALVDDIESYPRFLPWCTATRVEERTSEGVRATLTVGIRGLRQSFTTQNVNRPGESIEVPTRWSTPSAVARRSSMASLRVEVVYALARETDAVTVRLPSGATAAD